MDRIEFLNNLAETKAQYNLGAGIPPLHLYPNFSINELLARFKKTIGNELLHYYRTEGLIGALACETLFVNEGIEVTEDKVVLTNGVQEAIFLTLQLFRKNKVVCSDPFYPGLVDAARMLDSDIEIINEDSIFEKLECLREGDLFYISSDNANPTGKTLTLQERLRLIDIADRRGFYIFDDATYREFYLVEKLPSLFSMNPDRVIHALSFSKILAPGLRTAFIYLPGTLRKSFLRMKANASLNNSGITQALTGGWLMANEFNLSAHLVKLKTRLRENKNVLEDYNVSYSGGFFTTFKSNDAHFDLKVCNDLLLKRSVAVCPMSLFSESRINALRLCIANIGSFELEEALKIIINFNTYVE